MRFAPKQLLLASLLAATGVIATAQTTAPAAPKAGTPTTPRRKRRAYTPNFMRD